VSRSPEVRHLAMERVPDLVPVLVPATPRTDWSLPFMLLGRPTLLSHMSVMLAQRQLRAGELETGGDERRMGRDRVREVLAKAQARPQKLDDEELALGGSVDDDAALCVALAGVGGELPRARPVGDGAETMSDLSVMVERVAEADELERAKRWPSCGRAGLTTMRSAPGRGNSA
jgi:hypothetical protein